MNPVITHWRVFLMFLLNGLILLNQLNLFPENGWIFYLLYESHFLHLKFFILYFNQEGYCLLNIEVEEYNKQTLNSQRRRYKLKSGDLASYWSSSSPSWYGKSLPKHFQTERAWIIGVGIVLLIFINFCSYRIDNILQVTIGPIPSPKFCH